MDGVDREKLYEQVWTIPGARLAPLYGISDVALAKICKRYRIPRPPRGYWARLAAGQKVAKTPLPKLRDGQLPALHMGSDMPDEVFELNAAMTGNPPSRTQGDKPEPPVVPHELVITARTQLSDAKPDQNGLLRTDPATALNICVSPASATRALALFDSLIRRWEARGGSIRAGGGGDKTVLAMGEDEIYVQITEEINENKPISDPTRLTGRLCAELNGAGTNRAWADRKVQRLEKVLSTLVATAADALQREKAARLDRECVQRQVQRVEELRAAAEQSLNTEFERRQKLMEYANRWRDAELIRGYLSAVRAAIDAGKVRPSDEDGFREWFEWATLYADSIDPIVQARLPEEAPQGPINRPLAELDLTTRGKAVASALNVKDADDLARIKPDQLRDRYDYFDQDLWREFTRVLEALGYDVAKREHPWY